MTVLLVLVAVVLALVVGWIVVGLVFKLLWWALVGLLSGALARAILPGRQDVSLLATALAGIAGSVFGGILARGLGFGGFVQFLVAVGLAAAVIAVLGGTRSARA